MITDFCNYPVLLLCILFFNFVTSIIFFNVTSFVKSPSPKLFYIVHILKKFPIRILVDLVNVL